MKRIVVGLSCNFSHPDPARAVFKGKRLQYIEEELAIALHRAGALPIVLPDLKSLTAGQELVDEVAGLVLTGGADVSPESYGETPLDPKWIGDRPRDVYEIGLLQAAMAKGIPVLGICRGLQLLNVALGGSLYQDIATQLPGSLVHRDWERYEEVEHAITLERDSWIGRVYGTGELVVNTVHHQGIKQLAPGLRATAFAPDGVIEAVELDDPRFAVGLQWHPEWIDPATQPQRTPGDPVFTAFLSACARLH